MLLLSLSASSQAEPPGEYQLTVQYTADAVRNISGGHQQGSRYLDNLDVALSIPLGSVSERPGEFLLSAVYNNATGFSDLVGDLQGADNIDAPEALRIYEMWYELAPTENTSLRLGRMDLNSEFDVRESSQVFLHSSHGIGADFGLSGENGPSIFPVTTLGARLRFERDSWSLQGAIFDAVPGDPNDLQSNRLSPGGGILGVLELARHWGETSVLAGYWQYSDEFTLLADASGLAAADGNNGWYLSLEQRLGAWQVFFRYGAADSTFNAVDSYLGFGFVRQGLAPNHQWGIGVASAFTGSQYRARNEGTPHRESAIELTYDISINAQFNVQLELQQIDRPAALPDLDSAHVVGVRVTYAFEKRFGF